MMVLVLLLLLLSPAWSLAQKSEETQKEPSLVELARRERARRASVKKVPIITNASLKSMRGLVSTAERAPSAAGDSAEGGAEADAQAKESAVDWKGRFDDARRKVQDAVNRNMVLQLKMNDLRNSYLQEDDGTTQARIQQQLQETTQEIERSRQQIQAARDNLRELENEAQQAGLPPGEIRSLVGELPQAESITSTPAQ